MSVSDKPRWSVWRRRAGGTKTCTSCGYRHAEIMRDPATGKSIRPKVCLKCGCPLPAKLEYPAPEPVKTCPDCRHQHTQFRGPGEVLAWPGSCSRCGRTLGDVKPRKPRGAERYKWFVREFQPATGKTRDFAVASKEAALEFIRRKDATWTADPVQERVLQRVSALIRGLRAETDDDLVNRLITELGGDPAARTLERVPVREAIARIVGEMRAKDGVCAVSYTHLTLPTIYSV